MKNWFLLPGDSHEAPKIGRFRFLTLTILLMIGFRPMLDGLPGVEFLSEALFAAVLVAGIYAVRGEGHPYRLATALAISFFLFRIFGKQLDTDTYEGISLGIFSLFLLHALVNIILHLEMEERVSRDLVFEGACAYLLIGLIWACAFFIVERQAPGSYSGINPHNRDLWDFIYFSFVTLTSTGFGDIYAVTRTARALAMLEAILGQLYMAILIGRLVGAYASTDRSERL